MKCILNKCDNSGLIDVGNGQYEECGCKSVESAIRMYRKSNAPDDNMIFTSDLKENPIIKNEKKQEITMKQLIFSLMENGNLEKLVEENWFLYLVGKVGRGKTQFATSFSLDASFWREYKMAFVDERSLEHIVYDPQKKKELLEHIKNKEILIIDDIGVTGKVSHNPNLVQSVVSLLDYIVRSHKGLLIFTSNIRPEELKKSYGVANSEQLVSVINKSKRKTYYFTQENMREDTQQESPFF